MSTKPCWQCRRWPACEHPEKRADGRSVVQSCDLFRYTGERGDRVCINCAKLKANGGSCSGTEKYTQHCGSYEEIRANREVSFRLTTDTLSRASAYDGSEDMLQDLFGMQYELNVKAGFDAYELVFDDGSVDLQEAGKWLNAYITAMIGELCELRDMTYWKHWYKEARDGRQYEIHDLDHAKVEAVDCLFFLISMFECLGMNANEVFALYKRKLEKNHARQDDDCTTQEAKGYDL